MILNETISFTFEKNCGRLVYQLINGVSYMTIKSQIQELIEFLGENGVRVSPTFYRYPEQDQLKVLNKMIRELVA